MKLPLLLIAGFSMLSCTSNRLEGPALDVVTMLYSLSVSSDDVLQLSVYNPSDSAACTSYSNWLGPNDNLRVVGRDGIEWEYTGLIADPIGRPQDVVIGAHSEVTVTIDLRKNYAPTTPETRIGKVYFGTRFHHC